MPHLPAYFEELIASQYASEECDRIRTGTVCQRATTLRANAILSSQDEIAAQLDAAGIAWRGVPWYEDAFVLESAQAGDVRELPAYDAGKLYLQSLSSMLPALALDVQAGGDVCDLCAAPGGKTTQIVALAGRRAQVTACEMHAPRAEKLDFNLRRQGATNVTVMRVDARRLDEFFSFDRILLDAPCTGSGTLRADDPKAEKRFTPKLLEKSVKSQRALLRKALSLLKPGGVLVYSTCSILRQENDDIVSWSLSQTPRKTAYEIVPIEIDGSDDWPTLPNTIEDTVTLCPNKFYEGFFMAKVKRLR